MLIPSLDGEAVFFPSLFLRIRDEQLHEVVEMCESLGYQGFRARITHDQQRHVNARETLEYVARGRHLAFICDSWCVMAEHFLCYFFFITVFHTYLGICVCMCCRYQIVHVD